MNLHEKLNYVEYPCKDIAATKHFFESAFGWSFVDYGPDYAAFNDGKTDGGFYHSATHVPAANPLVVLYSEKLETALEAVEDAGGKISKEIYSFPGGRRFHFQDPAGNELAVWGE